MLNNQPLTKEQIISVAPSVYSDEPINGVSNRYKFVPTYKLLPTLKEAGFYCILAGQSKVRSDNENDKLYTKHILQFRHISHLMQPEADEEYLDIVITSSHNTKSSFSIDLAIVRTICKNMQKSLPSGHRITFQKDTLALCKKTAYHFLSGHF